MTEPLYAELPEDHDLFEEAQAASSDASAPSEGVYVDQGDTTGLSYVGEVQLPLPTPVELIVIVGKWQYFYKLDRREINPEVKDG